MLKLIIEGEKMIKKFFLCLMCSLLVMGICGCTKKFKISKDDINSQLNAKYNDTFSFVSSGNELWNEEYIEMIYSSKNLKTDIVVWVYPDGTFIDNYMAIKYKEEVENIVSSLAVEIYGSCKVVNIPIHYGKNHFNNNLSFNDYISNQQSDISVVIATDKDSSSAEEDIKKIALKFKDNKIITSIKVFYYDQSTFSALTETGVSTNPFSPLSDKRFYASMNEDYTIYNIYCVGSYCD